MFYISRTADTFWVWTLMDIKDVKTIKYRKWVFD